MATDDNNMSDEEETVNQPKLDQDHNTPFSPPDGVQDRIDQTAPATDTNIDSHEHYDEGVEGASAIDLPEESAVGGYNPPDDQEKKDAV